MIRFQFERPIIDTPRPSHQVWVWTRSIWCCRLPLINAANLGAQAVPTYHVSGFHPYGEGISCVRAQSQSEYNFTLTVGQDLPVTEDPESVQRCRFFGLIDRNLVMPTSAPPFLAETPLSGRAGWAGTAMPIDARSMGDYERSAFVFERTKRS